MRSAAYALGVTGYCIPETETIEDMIDTVVRYLENDSTTLDYEASSSVLTAMAIGYPCKKGFGTPPSGGGLNQG